MSIESHPTGKPLAPAPPPSWGEVAPVGQAASVMRFVLVDRVVTFPTDQFKRWEHVVGVPEMLTLSTGNELVVVEGRELSEIRAALDLGRLCELRVNYPPKSGTRPGPQVRRIAIEAA